VTTFPDSRPPPSAQAELEALLEETRRLEREGRLDAQALARFKARGDAVSRRMEEETNALLARAREAMQELKKPGRPAWQQWTLGLLMIAVMLGAFASFVDGGFVFAQEERYRAAMPFIFAAVALLLAFAMLRAERRTHAMRLHASNPFARWLVLFPAMVAVSALLAIFAPLGWASIYTRVAGDVVEGREGRLLALAAPRHGGRNGCRQGAEVFHAGETANLCLDDRVAGTMPAPGDHLLLAGWQTRAGLYVGRIQRR
jgi:uncharacterized membrane protein YidH (DUF202 family)